MATLLTTDKAPIIDVDSGDTLGTPGQVVYDVQSSDLAVVTIGWDDWRAWAYAQGVGSATITATRLADGAVATLDVEVTAPVAGPFAIDLGPAVPK